MTTFAQAAARLGDAAASVAGKGSEKALAAAGVEAKTVMVRGSHRDIGSDETLSGYGRRRNRGRVPVQARFDPAPGLRIIVEPTKRSRGLWALLEAGSAKAGPTWKTPRRAGVRRARGTVGTYTRAAVPARHTWSQSVPSAADAAAKAYHAAIVRTVFSELRGG